MELTKVQSKIISVLQDDPRISMRSLAQEVGVSTPTASRTVKELEDMGVILGYRTVLNTRILGMHTFHITIDPDLNVSDDAACDIARIPEVHEMREMENGVLHVELLVPSLDELDRVTRSMRGIKGIRKLEVSRVTGWLKSSTPVPLDSAENLHTDCYYCKKTIEGDPVKLNMDGKKHYLCCEICAREYRKKYEALKKKSDI